MKILFCTDGSEISFNAIENISKWITNATVDTICITDWSFLPDEINIEEENFTYSCARIASTILDFATDKINNLGMVSKEEINGCGSAIDNILEQAKKEHYDLIVMGSHGKKGIQKWLGSVSQEIINSSKNSCYVAKEINDTKRLLITTDGTECSNSIVESIMPNLNLQDKEIHVCMVNDDPNLLFLDGTLDTQWILDIQKRQYAYATKVINEIKKILAKYNYENVKSSILTGNPAQEIINYTEKNKIDLCLLGSHEKSKLEKFLIGSVSKRVLENSTCDVLLARCKKIDPNIE